MQFNSSKDTVFAAGHWQRRFTFDAAVASVFDDMALRSIPLYREVLGAVTQWSERFVQADSHVYDLGCSTGSSLAAVVEGLGEDASQWPRGVEIVGIDNSEAMISNARAKFSTLYPQARVTWRREDILATEMMRASFVVLNYVLQFLPLKARKDLLIRIREVLLPGGVVFVSEKLSGSTPVFHEMITELYEDFKFDQNYSRDEIARKKESLDQVLVPLKMSEQFEMFRAAGFSKIEVVLKWNQFATFVLQV